MNRIDKTGCLQEMLRPDDHESIFWYRTRMVQQRVLMAAGATSSSSPARRV